MNNRQVRVLLHECSLHPSIVSPVEYPMCGVPCWSTPTFGPAFIPVTPKYPSRLRLHPPLRLRSIHLPRQRAVAAEYLPPLATRKPRKHHSRRRGRVLTAAASCWAKVGLTAAARAGHAHPCAAPTMLGLGGPGFLAVGELKEVPP